TTFAVPLSCEDCIEDISWALHKLDGTTAPSAIVAAIQATGRDAILRGSGTSDTDDSDVSYVGASVCILESHAPNMENKVKGLVRMVQVAPNLTIIDLSIRGVSPGNYHATVRENGDISQGPESTGGVWETVSAGQEDRPCRGVLGPVEVGQSGLGTVFLDKPIQIWELIGRSIVVSQQREGKFDKNDRDTIVGVIARSAGLWDNDKMVCSCSGKTVWEERKEQSERGML
ncbi:superoxide dismutase 1 copper chaperone, partial [Pseudovirgaria hyperparasitica]